MKKYISILFVFGFLFFFQSYSAQEMDSKTVDALVNSQDFTFHAQRANPTNYDVIKVMNSMPNSTSTRILDLNGDYTIIVKDKMLEVVLPYFGRSFKANIGGDNSYRFTSKDYTVTKSQNKKGKWTIKIKPNDVNNVDEIIIEVFKNGKAFTSVRGNDRQPISYDGYISKSEETK
ncbi:DUF4251 domain-containing protein [Chryseobacterium sp. ERMR1:04]|uniref:DUF4251 domain-containing protein n=1 Tax=Chryseobacterium sp. ERMR1:04 TaxID=1705393 RepID=UPI0006C873BC|nr:DUF4251 domain-containing protein [Chryseobacterium sp. ERMR1:04]KPH12012.1 hypothetical protein AMQ68_21985 [Chryseobacterium sp. ERMR1:04]